MKKLKLKNSLAILKNEKDLVRAIVDNVKEQLVDVDLNTMKYNTQLVTDIMICVESSVTNKKGRKKINKKDIVLKVFEELFKDVDLNVVEEMIEFAFENKLISNHSIFIKLVFGICNFFLTK